MSYVSEPYQYVTDQVLIALTGGVARETHRFFAGANAFAFEKGADAVLPESVRAIGQANGEFFSFELERDFAVGQDGTLRFLASADDPSLPDKGASWPDEGTEFYVGYDHTGSGTAPLTDRNVGSLTRTIAEAFARELAVLRQQLEMVYESGFVDTAEGSALDMVVALLGLARKTRDFGFGTVRFSRPTPAPGDIFIPAGTRVSTALAPPAGNGNGGAGAKSKPVAFTTTEDRTLRRGQLTVEVSVRAEEKGSRGVVDAKAITVVNQPILGITGVTNDAPTVFGGAGESDEELRRRAKTVAQRAGRATPRSLVNALTELSAIRENDVKVVEELALRPGVVQVFVASDPTADLAVAVQEAILDARAAGIKVEHNLEAFLPAAPDAAESSGDQKDDGATEEGPAPDGFRYPLCADVVVFPEDPRLAGPDKDAMQQAVVDAVSAYVDASTVGGTIVYSRVSADLMDIAGVNDVVLNLAPTPSSPDTACLGKRNIVVPQGQRAVIDPAAQIKVTFAGAPVYFDFQVKVTPTGGNELDAIRAEVRTRLGAFFATNPNPVDSTGLIAQIGAGATYTLVAGDLSWTAEYDQAGLIVREPGGATASTAIVEGDRAVLRDIRAEVKT